MKKLNFLHYDALLHLPCLKSFSEEQQFQIIDEAESRAGSLLMRYKLYFIIMTSLGLLVAAALYLSLNSIKWPSIWMTIWFSFVMIFSSASRKLKHLSPAIEQIASEKKNNI